MSKWEIQEYSDAFIIQDAEGNEVAIVIRRGTNEEGWAEDFDIAKMICKVREARRVCDDVIALYLHAEATEWDYGDVVLELTRLYDRARKVTQ